MCQEGALTVTSFGGDITLYFRTHCVDIRLFETKNGFVDVSTVRGLNNMRKIWSSGLWYRAVLQMGAKGSVKQTASLFRVLQVRLEGVYDMFLWSVCNCLPDYMVS
jgi:hypothetical protein